MASETVFSDDFSDEGTKQESYKSLREEVYGPSVEVETELDMEDVMIIEPDCVPQYIDPNDEPTKRLVRNPLGKYEPRMDEEPTLVQSLAVAS
jgi:hypothetical protein